MIFLKRSAHLPIGVDLGRDSIKVLQLEERPGGVAVIAKSQTPAPVCTDADRAPAMIARLGELVRQGQFRGRQIVLPLPRELVQVKTLRMPVLPETELQAAVRPEAEHLFATPADSLFLRTILAGEVRQGTESRLEVLVLAVAQKAVDQLLEQCNQAGLMVDSLEFEPCCLYRGIERFVRRKEDENEVNVLVDVGLRESQVIIGRGRDITFNKVIEIGGDSFNELVARKLGLNKDEAAGLRRRFSAMDPAEKDPVRQTVVDATRAAMADLAHEVSLCLRYYSVTFRGQRPSRLRLLGGEANDVSLRQMMAGSMSVPIEVFHPLQGIGSTESFFGGDEPLGEWSVAFGAALRRVRSEAAHRSGPAVHRRKNDASIVEVVDVIKSVEASTEAVPKTAEVARA